MVVVKIGGSLQNSSYLRKWVEILSKTNTRNFLVICGGGKYADKVRNQQKIDNFSDEEAHYRSIDAMKKYTDDVYKITNKFYFLKSIYDINIKEESSLYLWVPNRADVDSLDVPKNWTVTSDAIALKISEKLDSPLIIVKSCNVNYRSWNKPLFLNNKFLDSYFINNYSYSKNKIDIIHRNNYYMLEKVCSSYK